jgi:hypothetical protein
LWGDEGGRAEGVAAVTAEAEGAEEARVAELGEVVLSGALADVEEALVVGAGERGASGEEAEELGLAAGEAAG